MAAYNATREKLEALIGESTLNAIADRDGDGVADDEVVEAALVAACGIADSYLGDYLPISVVPDMLTQAILQIANETLRLAEQSTEDSRRGYDRAIAWLVNVSKGVATLPGQPTADLVLPGDPVVDSYERVWDRRSGTGIF